MIYLLSSLYLSVNLVLRSLANSESATMTSRKLISSISKLTSESASMTFFVNAMTYLFPSFYLSVNLVIRSCATSEPASMTFFVNAIIYLSSSLNLSVNRSTLRLCATSEPATITSQ